MQEVNITELRNRLPTYLKQVQAGEEIRITSRGRVIARLVPEQDEHEAARQRLLALRDKCCIGDVVSPIDERWDAEQ